MYDHWLSASSDRLAIGLFAVCFIGSRRSCRGAPAVWASYSRHSGKAPGGTLGQLDRLVDVQRAVDDLRRADQMQARDAGGERRHPLRIAEGRDREDPAYARDPHPEHIGTSEARVESLQPAQEPG